MTYLNVSDQKIYYEVDGEGVPLVMCHAGFVDSGMWDTQWDAFKQHFRVIRFDMRGYGMSDAVNSPISRREDLHQLLNHLNIERAHLLGCSLGGEVIIDYALDHPERVFSLIPVSAVPGGFEMQGEPPRYMMEMIEAAQKGDVERASELQMRIWVDGQFREPEQVDAGVRHRAAEMNKIPVERGTFTATQPLNPLTTPAVGRLSDIRVPTRAIVGSLDHPEIHRGADFIAKEIKSATKVVIEGAAHVPNMEKPAEFNQIVLEFLQAIK